MLSSYTKNRKDALTMPLRSARLYNKGNTPGHVYFDKVTVPGRYLNPSTGQYNEVVERQDRWFYQEDGLPTRARRAKEHLKSQDIPVSFVVPIYRKPYKPFQPARTNDNEESYEVFIYHPFIIPTSAKTSHNKTTF